MEIETLLILAVVVVIVAYALGRYMRGGEGKAGAKRPARIIDEQPRPAREARPPLGKPLGDREMQAVVQWLLSQAFEQTGVKVADDKVAYQRIVEAAQKAMQELKTRNSVTISLPFLTADASGPKHFETRLTRETIQELVRY